MPPVNSLPDIHQIIRSNRRSFSLEIKSDGKLIVRAPRLASQVQIKAVVTSKADWIRKKQAQLAKKHPPTQPKAFTPGETFWYLGEQYPLRLTERQRPSLDLDGAFLLSRAAKPRAKEVFIEWYREETRQITARLIQGYTKRYDLQVSSVRITSARTRWGSCSGKQTLNFTYRLCMAPLSVVEYVVVHELAHLKEHNHSRAFWQWVAAMKPDYLQDRAWLKHHGVHLTLD